MAVSKNNIRVPITIPKELKQQLDKVAKEDKRTLIIYIYSRKSVYTGKGKALKTTWKSKRTTRNLSMHMCYLILYYGLCLSSKRKIFPS